MANVLAIYLLFLLRSAFRLRPLVPSSVVYLRATCFSLIHLISEPGCGAAWRFGTIALHIMLLNAIENKLTVLCGKC